MTQVRPHLKDDPLALRDWILGQRGSFVFVDGTPCAGKSYLLRQLHGFGLNVIDADDFLVPDQGQYAGALNTEALLAAARSKTSPVIIAGVCARDIAKLLTISNAMHVYLIRVSEAGVDEYSPAHDASREGKWMEDNELPPPGVLEREVIAYHIRERPIETADVVYRNTVPDQQ